MNLMDQKESERLLATYKIPFSKLYFTKNINKALKTTKKIGFPVVLKIASKKIVHKSDIWGVITDIKNDSELRDGYKKINKKFKTKIQGIYIQKMLKGKELIIGMKRDVHFGPVIMFGLGGIFVEVMKDVSFRVAPVSKREAANMIKEIKAYPTLKGIRGKKPISLTKVSEIIYNLSRLSIKNKEIKQIDLNPVIADEKNAVVVDVRILL